MENHSKLTVFRGIIEYILDSTCYTLKNIAEFSNAPISSIRSIYIQSRLPDNFKSEVELLQLYQIILEIHLNREKLSCLLRHNS